MPSESFAIARGKELGPGARLGLSENRPSPGARSSGIVQKVVQWREHFPTPPSRLAPLLRSLCWPHFLTYFFTPRTASFAALATRNLTTVLAGILIFCCVFGLKPVRAFLFCFTSLPKPGKTNSPFFLISL